MSVVRIIFIIYAKSIIFTFEMFYRDADTPPWLKEQCGHCD